MALVSVLTVSFFGGATVKPRPVVYSVAGFKLSASQKRASISHFLEQNVCPSRARLVLRKYWE